MKKLLFIFSLCLVTVMANAAMPYDYSTFFAASATGSGVLEKTGYSVLTWGIAQTNNGGTNPTIASSSMNYTDANSTSYIDNNAGSAISLASIASAPIRSSIFYLTSSGLAIGTTYYVSALINISAATSSSSTFLNLNNSSNGGSSYGQVKVKTATGGYVLVVSPGASATNSAASSTLSFGTTHLIVLKFVLTTLTNSDAYLYIDPNFGTEGSPTLSGLNNTGSITAVKGLVITQNIGVTGTVAGLRFGTSWTDVVKGKLATPSVTTGATTVTSGGFTANWATVTNASNYTLTVYNSNGTTNQTITGISSSATSYDITGLTPSTSYTYKVTAIGNGTTFINSDQSTAASFSTSASVVPVLSVDAISGTFGSQAINMTTGPNSFTISGTLLTNENVTVGALSGYSYSTSAGGTYTSSLSLSQSGGTFSQQIFVKFTPTTYTSYNGNIVVGGGGVGASTVNCAVTGSGIYAEPTTQASALTFSNFTGTSFTVNWTAGNGSNSIVLVKSASAVDSNPSDATSYTANTAFGSGSQIGTGNYVVYNSTGNSVAVTGLTKGTKYYVSVYTFSGSGGTENYLISSSASGSQLAVSTITSSGSGTWASLGAGQYDDVIILNGHTIDVAASGAKCNNLTINAGGKIWANTTSQTLSVYGTSLVCDGTFGDSNNALTSGSQLILGYGNIIDITGNGGIYPYKIQPVTGMTPIGVTFDANVTATYGTAGVQTDNTGNTNVTLTVSAGKTLTVPGNMTTTGSATGVGTGNVTIDVRGTINITGALNTTAAIGKTSTLTVYNGGLITTGKFALSPAHQVQAATYTINTGGEIRVTSTTSTAVDCSHTTITSAVVGGGTFSTTSSGSTVALGNAAGLDATTGPIRTTTRNFDANTNFSFIGTSAQSTGSYLPSTVNNLTINNAAGVTLSGSTTVNGTLNLTAGTLTNTSYNVTLGNIATISRNTGSLVAAPVFGSTVNLTYTGSTATTPANEFPVSAAITTLTVNNTAGLSLTPSITAVANLTVGSGAILNLNAGKQLTVSTTHSNSGTINLLSDNTNGVATILTPATIAVTGTTNVQQYLTAGRNWYISSPVSNATSNVFNASANVLYSYDETNAAWPQITDNITGLGVMTGYVTNVSSNGAVSFTGTLNNGAQQIGLTRHTGVTKEGFNLIGNPYPSYLNFESALASASTSNVSQTVWFRARNGGNTAYIFDTYSALNHVGTSNNNNSLVGITADIPPMQAFWVRVADGQTSGTLAVDNSMRSHLDQSVTTNRFKAPAVTEPVLHLQVSNGLNNDEAIVLFNPNASNGYDAYDSEKMSNSNVAIPEIYTLAGTEQLVINGFNSIQYDTEIPLGFTTGESNTFTIKASQFSNFVSGTQIILRDKVLNFEQDLTVANYSFTSDVTMNNTSRFAVLFKAPSVATGINSTSNNNTWISTNSNNQVVIKGGGSVAIYNAVGQKLSVKNLTANTTVIETPLQSGVYLVAVTNAGKTLTQKVIVK